MVVCPLPSPLLSIVPAALEISRVLPTTKDVTIEAGLAWSPVTCPACGLLSRRLHSHYPRVLRDLPWQGRPATIRVTARRFRCLNPACARKTFAERLGSIAPALARRTARLGDLQRHVAFALGGEAAARLAERLAIPTSPDTLLRMAAKPVAAEIPRPTPKVLGVDDWAWRRGHRYGTILVDLERNEVVDLLPDRQAETLAAWLRQHPDTEIVARDRAGAYADGIRQGAPEALQASDRWHLLRNLGDAVRAVVDRHHGALRHAAQQMDAPAPPPPAEEAFLEPAVRKVTLAQRRSEDAHARRHGRYEDAARMRAAGSSISAIATAPGTVRKWAEGRRKAEPQTDGRPSSVTGLLPSNCKLARLLMTDGDVLPNADRNLVTTLLNQVPPVAVAITVAKQLNMLLRRKISGSLTQILDVAVTTPLKEFAASLRRDLAAIQASLDLPWTTSPVEGQTNRLKMLKRTMYRRAGFQLLRARVLHAA